MRIIITLKLSKPAKHIFQCKLNKQRQSVHLRFIAASQSVHIAHLKMLRRTPIIVILGSTATGKTKLSIELAKRFGGEVISADSMQIYKGLDISTAKATKEEQSEAVHHLLDVCDVNTRTFTVVDFRNKALPIIDRLLSESKMPMVVGGTTYYIESLLWKVLIGSKESGNDTTDYNQKSIEEIAKILSEHEKNPKEPLLYHNLLAKVDPVTAERLHPNNERRVRRALEVFIETGKPMSKVLTEQRSEEGGSYLGGPLRYEHVICFWTKSEQTKLDARIDRRIDGMIAQGMIFEIRKAYNSLIEDGIDPTRGMMQAIGFKEFLPYLEQYTDETFDSEITKFILDRGGLSGQKKFIIKNRISDALTLLEKCLDDLRLHTKQYSKKQIKWIRNRLISNKGRIVPPVYELDTTNAETNWHDDVYLKAVDVVQSYLDNKEPEMRPAERVEHPTSDLNMHVTHFCDVCQRRFVGDLDYNHHMNSRKHKLTLKHKREEAKKAIASSTIASRVMNTIWIFFGNVRSRFLSFFRRS